MGYLGTVRRRNPKLLEKNLKDFEKILVTPQFLKVNWIFNKKNNVTT